MIRRVLTALAGIALLAGCGGGSGPSAPLPAAPLPAATLAAPTGGASQNRTPVATATLTLKFPAGFHTATISSKARKPAYVNSNSNYLDVWVNANGSLTHVVDSSGGANVSATADGSQTFLIPLYSYDNNQIVAYESNSAFGTYGTLLAVGEDDLGTFSAGSAPQIALTMQMGAQFIGTMTDTHGTGASTTSPFLLSACIAQNYGPIYFFTADAQGGFVDLAGAGGTSLPLVSGWTSDPASPGNSLSQGSGVSGGYSVFFTIPTGGGVTVRLTATNPAYAIANSVLTSAGLYPGAATLYSSSQDPSFNYMLYYGPWSVGPNISTSVDVQPNDLC